MAEGWGRPLPHVGGGEHTATLPPPLRTPPPHRRRRWRRTHLHSPGAAQVPCSGLHPWRHTAARGKRAPVRIPAASAVCAPETPKLSGIPDIPAHPPPPARRSRSRGGLFLPVLQLVVRLVQPSMHSRSPWWSHT